ncbi:MAG: hypothetical protein ACXVV5_21075 [Solirubrobacteraceae bacterium]
MTDLEIITALAAANPLPREAAERADLNAAERELLEELRALTAPEPRGLIRPTRRPRVRRIALVAAVATAAVGVLVVLLSGPRDAGGPAPAYAAELVRFANASPLVVLDAPGWHVVYADEESAQVGELRYVRGAADREGIPKGFSQRAPATFAGRGSSLEWLPGQAFREMVRDRAASASIRTTAPVLGTTAQVFGFRGAGYMGFTALWVYNGRVMQYGAPVRDLAMFRAQLRELRQVDTNTWLRALPPSVVQTATRRVTIHHMLGGVPLPPGFNVAQIPGSKLIKDRYQLGAAVTGTVACAWVADWARARAAGDSSTVNTAVAAMATAPRWPILREMAREGFWSQLLIEMAKAMPSGRWHGRPLAGAFNSNLGCSRLGVRMDGR